MFNNGLFTRNPKPEAASVTLAYYSAPFILNLDSTIAASIRWCFGPLKAVPAARFSKRLLTRPKKSLQILLIFIDSPNTNLHFKFNPKIVLHF
jgi:hypothetical protein